MNIIENLIAELCPEGVEFKELGEVGELIGGSGLPKTDFAEYGVGCIHYGQIYTYYGIHTNQTISFVSKVSSTKLKKVTQGDIIIAKTSENIEDICKSVAYLGADEIVTGGHTAIFKHKQDPKYISYYINGAKNFQIQKRKYTIGVKVKDVSLKNLAKIKIPIPPILIQEEIVKILDNFTELEARKKQYEYYREELLSFDDGVKFKELGDVATIKHGKDYKKYNEGNVPVYGSGGVMTHIDTYSYNLPTVLIPRKGTITNIFYVETPFWNVDTIYYTEININKIIVKYFYYFMKTVDLKALDTGSGRPSLTMQILNKIKIPIPPISEQKRIVKILDKFDALVNDISTGLPAELNARKKQYEYYREKLLTFKEKTMTV